MKIALIENFGSDFYGARLRYALFLQGQGHEVVAIVPNDGYAEKIQEAGINTIALDIDIRKRSISTVFSFATQLRKIFIREKFDIIHLYRLQPNLIGTPVAFFSSRKSKLVNHITGLGVAFTKTSLKFNLIKTVVITAYKLNNKLCNATLIYQNEEDKAEIGINNKRTLVVKGSAVNEDRFNLNVEANIKLINEVENCININNGKTLIFVSRLLKQKGLTYLIEAVNKINNSDSQTKFNLLIAGWIDPNNPDSLTEQEIKNYDKSENIVFLGKRTDINELIALADIAVLPTYYREGTPRFLLEAMAMGKPILTTNMPGCNHLVKNNKNGKLIEPKSIDSIIDGLLYLNNANLEEMGKSSRLIYESEFSENVVYNQLLNAYKS